MAAERRRGEALEVAILEAASEILSTEGYEQMTFQNVAKRARTSRTVIYARYQHKFELLHALAQYRFKQAYGGNLLELVVEQGTLREDLLAVLKLYQQFLDSVGPELVSAILYELSQNNESLRALSIRGQEGNVEMMKKIMGFAKRRGEVNAEFSVMQMSLPFDLLRYENMIRGGRVTEEYLGQFVDEVLMPMFRKKR